MELNEIKKLIPEKLTAQSNTLLSVLEEMGLSETIKCEGLLHFLIINNVLSLEQTEQDYPEAEQTLNVLDKIEKIKISIKNSAFSAIFLSNSSILKVI